MTTPLDRAQEILQIQPLPRDARERIDALYQEADDLEKTFFEGIYEALAVAEMDEGV
jgi:hypothetical protein